MQVSLQALKAFESAARLGSFKAAADELSLTPTAISHHINNLESRLNIDLFYRQVRKISLTPTGEYLSEATSEGFNRIEQALDRVQTAGKSVKITTTSSLAALRLIPALQELSISQPSLKVDISTSELVEVQSHTLPIRFGEHKCVTPDDMITKEQFNVFGLHTVQTYPWLNGPVTLYTTEWKNNTLTEPPLAQWLAQNTLSPSLFIVKTYDQELFCIQEAMAGSGLVFCSTTLVKRLLNTKLLKHYGTQAVASDFCYYVPKKQRFQTRDIRLVLEWVEEMLR
ncbi:LysR family transcriptional regulator [Pseudoalteromonas sp. H105]|uniref:LysR family transcriptional regulator n=1 Tax=Pseudoalteromonas sp. H105 TaxID=1348393 RepID=UPI0007322C5F|nr:LysR family transcriptional regulator [Pseudoalteromonas sp. H105]KTF16927.1 LysR family transcriptional regulator [Pseudoalteromonas sp. H105]